MKSGRWRIVLHTRTHGNYVIILSGDEWRVIETGAQTLKLLQTTRLASWSLWAAVGDALVIVRDKVMAVVGTKTPGGSTYNTVFSAAMHRFKLLTDGATRSHLFDLMAARESVEQWLASLPPARARKYTHPNTVWRQWKASQ
jgi:hypothetical protein